MIQQQRCYRMSFDIMHPVASRVDMTTDGAICESCNFLLRAPCLQMTLRPWGSR